MEREKQWNECLATCLPPSRRHFVVPPTYRLLRSSLRKIKITFGSVRHYWSYSLRLVIQQHPAVDTHYISAYTVLSLHTEIPCRPWNVSKSNHKRTVIRQVITGVINSLFLLAVLWYGRAGEPCALWRIQAAAAAAAAADKVFIIIAGNPSGYSLARDLLPPNQGFN